MKTYLKNAFQLSDSGAKGLVKSIWSFFLYYVSFVPPMICVFPVSYTHLDVYKRQSESQWKYRGSGKGETPPCPNDGCGDPPEDRQPLNS